MKGETPEIGDDSGIEYWGNLLSIYRNDKRKRAKAKAKEENSKVMRAEPFAEPETEQPRVDYLSIKKKVQDEIQDISSLRDEESKTIDIDDEGIYSPDKAGDSFYAKRTGDKFYDEPTTAKKRPLIPEPQEHQIVQAHAQVLQANTTPNPRQQEELEEILDYLSPDQRQRMMATVHQMVNISAKRAEEAKKDVDMVG